ncbi:MAG TPA: EamA family transporter, partial [Chroococcales cyanobacterium]
MGTQQNKNVRLLTIAAFLSIYLIWGSTYLAIKYAIDSVPPFMMAGARFLLAGAILYLYMRLTGAERPTFKNWVQASIVGTLLLTLGNGGVVLAEKYVPTGICALLVAMVPVYVAVLEHVNKGLPNRRTVAGLILGTLGIFILVGPAAFISHSAINWFGVAAVLLGSLGWSIGSVYARGANLPKSPMMSTAMQMLSGGFILTLVSLVMGEFHAM